ncbi:hypothetical protein ACIRU8_45615 [Streptomyces sp. NPDC101175]|uniref:hypothetical protein n=1 Tax=Streptomyces sp. NPDC101175 TaxID=3366123 RepID=UPI00383252AD
MPADEVTHGTDVDASRVRTGPRHAAPKKPLFTRLHMPAGKAIATVAMPTAVIMGMGFTSSLALADNNSTTSPSSKSLTAEEYKDCVSALAESTASPTATPSASESSDSATDDATPSATATGSATKDTDKTSSSDSGSDDTATSTPSATASKSAQSSDSSESTATATPSATASSESLLDTIGDAITGILTGGSSSSSSDSTATATPTPTASASASATSASSSDDSSKASDTVKETVEKAADTVDDTVKDTTDTATKAADEATKAAEDTATATATPSASASTDTSDCPVATDDTSGVDNKILVPDDPWYLSASSLLLKGADYQGVVEVKTASGKVKKVLKYVISGGTDIGDLHQTVDDKQSGKTYHVQAAKGSTSTIRDGDTVMYTESISGNLFGLIPITFDPDNPPPLNIPLIYFTNVKVVQAGQFGGTLTVPGLHNYID